MATPRYRIIKQHICRQIETGVLNRHARVPSENELASGFNVSRMTARRALTELVDEGVLIRTRGRGTFVADNRAQSSMLAIRNIADEIRDRGHHWRCEVLSLQQLDGDSPAAQSLDLNAGSPIAHSRLLHYENDLPVQLEERSVNLQLAPGYLQQDYQRITPHEYLCQVAPLTEADHSVEAVAAGQDAALLQVDTHTPCLLLNRRTYSREGIVSLARLLHPGPRYRLGAHLILKTS